MRYSTILLAPLFVASALGCGKPQSASQAERARDPLQETARDAAQAIRRQTDAASAELDQFAQELRGTAQSTRSEIEKRLDAEMQQTKKAITSKANQQAQEMAEFAAQMAEDAKDRALDIPDVLDEFFGAPRERRSGNRGDRPRR